MSKRIKTGSASTLTIPPLAATISKLFEYLDDVQYWIKDLNGRYCWVNRGFLLNYALEHAHQVIGKSDYDLSPLHLADQYCVDDERVLKGDVIAGRIQLVGRFDHSSAWSVTHKLPIHDEQGRIVGTTGTTRKIELCNPQLDAGKSALGRVIALIREDCARNWTNRELAKHSNLSVRAFERHFRRLFHVSPHDYIRRLRVRLASHALVYSAAPIAQIAADHGFADQSHLTREFRRETSLTPSAYRQRFGVDKAGA